MSAFLSALLPAAGEAVASGIMGKIFGGSSMSPRKQAAMNWDYQVKAAKQMPSYHVQGAKAAGLHPLFTMGGSASSSAPTVIGQQDSGYNRAGDVFAQALARRQIQEHELAIQQQRANIEKTKTETKALNSAIGKVIPNPTFNAAEDWESRYGGFIGEIYGMANYLNDRDFFGMSDRVKKWYRQHGKNNTRFSAPGGTNRPLNIRIERDSSYYR